MSYYTVLITAWNNASQASGATLPANVTGSLLTGLTTAQKTAAINAWTVIGPAITPNIPVTNVIACIQSGDLLNLTSIQLQAMQFVLQSGQTSVYAPIGGTVRGVFASIFSGKTATLNALTALVAQYDSPQINWAQAPVASGGAGLTSPVGVGDLAATGLS